MEALTTRLREVEDGKETIPPQSTIWRDRVEPAKDGASPSGIQMNEDSTTKRFIPVIVKYTATALIKYAPHILLTVEINKLNKKN